MKTRIVITLVGILFAIATNADALPQKNQYTFGVAGSHFFMGESGSNALDDLDSFNEISLSSYVSITNKISIGGELGYGELKTKNLDIGIKAVRAGAGGRYHLTDYAVSGIRPMLGAGINIHNYDSSGSYGSKTEFSVYGEVGAQKTISDRWILEVGLRNRFELEDAYTDQQLFAGVNYVFGSRERPTTIQPAQPAQAIVSAAEPEPQIETTQLNDQPEKIVDSFSVTQKNMNFRTGSAEVKRDFDRRKIKEFAKAVQASQNHSIIVEGHTDSTGTEKFNDGLSVRRANSVKALFVEKMGVDPAAIVTRGFGENQPAHTNDTAEGRAENRRVEIKLRDDSEKNNEVSK